MPKSNNKIIDILTSLSKRRGFIFQSSEIYGGLASTWDYGPLGVELKRNIKDLWWKSIVTANENVVGMDSAILMHPKVWEASGHVENFHDPLIDNKETKKRYRVDHLLNEQEVSIIEALLTNFKLNNNYENRDELYQAIIVQLMASENSGAIMKNCGVVDPFNKKIGDWTDLRQFNLMFKTHMGPVQESGSEIYMRPETAQGIFVNYLNIQSTARQKLPFGIAQIGKAFRNEITTGNFIFRTREFEQMEMEFFCHKDDTKKWLKYWSEERLTWFKKLGIAEEKLRLRAHADDELAHYSSACFDVEYKFDFGWSELEGIADRGTYDLDQHMEHSSKKLTYFDTVNNNHFVPAVVETSAGVDRAILTVLADAYKEEEVNGDKRTVLKLSPKIAPINVAIFPLMNKQGMPEIAQKLTSDLKNSFRVFYDSGGSIGKRYRRQDEAGTPLGITIDHDTISENTVTLRNRDTMEQSRVSIEKIKDVINDFIT
ncbi:MAG: glycine--tRNA ligase [Candidatus Marinimicrobia bacterium]|nr:glycine--tRNA ligase [Candidatus Neomarinimicrobiota bacterium]|tara:strand:+ start:26362 stop:27819 length:1458 start_codon:yes stop_codon:yes gene_type:complete